MTQHTDTRFANASRRCAVMPATLAMGRALFRGANPLAPTSGLVALLITSTMACHDEPVPQPAKVLPTAKVRVQTVQKRQHQAVEEVVGTVRAKQHATIAGKVSGRIAQMKVTLGQKVKADQLLARIDVQEIRAKLAQANATRAQANADLKRFSKLLEGQAVTRQEFDAARARAHVARATVQEARSMLAYAAVTAPFAGVVTRKLADVGDLATPGRPLLEIEVPTAMRLEINVPEALIGRIKQADRVPVRIAGLPKMVEGTVVEVAPSSDPNSRTSLVKLDLPTIEALRVGQFGRATIPTAATTILRVKAAAVVVRGQMEIVFVVTDGRAQLRLVKTGKRSGDELEIVSGLVGGDVVAIDGAVKLVDGQPVEVVK